ncbi:MAG: methionyl-tRNA formyltransferase [Gammaproteobacteria bacterium]|nr:methionyl-tRNA formyltransferase [Gammaproteobacteria bacterium]MCP4880579.1 methionyl-tRNA formyltransferase [Gammaproteobacteria bacterium]
MSNQNLRIIFAGTPEFAAQHLQALINSHHDVVAVYSQPDRPAGRGRKLTASPVKQLAMDHQLEIQQPLSLKEPDTQAQLASYQADIMVVVAYGLLLPQVVLDIPRLGCINVHGSLLPRWRGAAPIQRALLAGDAETGITIMQMAAGLDTGPMLHKSTVAISEQDTSASLYDKLAIAGCTSLIEVLDQIECLRAQEQDEKLTCYADKLSKSEGVINWQQPAPAISLQVRGLNPWPVAYTGFSQQKLRIWMAQAQPNKHTDMAPGTVIGYSKQGINVACGQGQLLITALQWPGSKAISGAQLKNLQQKLPIGSLLGREDSPL